ncbi:protein EMBRYO DEFECTIVE 514 [Vigna umbellata]|uniref:protein EMBRYO DEFECTIVE 514 n=1 Tax=Vigna umbellata TaxID=87088 RepID=UPI001F5FF400|nr:protein EMBRYO DEFECTIVE 514 [Vigna umbellata]
MAEPTAPEPGAVDHVATDAAVDMAVESSEQAVVDSASNGEPNQKRSRENHDDEVDGVSKKQKVEPEEKREHLNGEDEEEKKPSVPVKLGYISFASSVEMFDYFNNLLHTWPPYLNLNQYEHTMLLELLKNGHTEPDEKIGGRIRVFQVRNHSRWKSRCFFLIRDDESVDDFSFRKCVDHILPLPVEMQVKPDANRALGGGAKVHRGKSGGRGHGKKGGSKH